MIIARREHEFSYGHRVVGHEGKCKQLHGHNATVIFYVEPYTGTSNALLDSVGRVVDFSEIKARLCQWLEDNWDHKFLMWEEDPLILGDIDGEGLGLLYGENGNIAALLPNIGVVTVPFNPTAENMAKYLVEEVGPKVFIYAAIRPLPIRLVAVEFFETKKCSVFYRLEA